MEELEGTGVVVVLQIQHQLIASYYYPLIVLDGRSSVQPLLNSDVSPGVEVSERQPFGAGPAGDIGGILRVEVRPLLDFARRACGSTP